MIEVLQGGMTRAGAPGEGRAAITVGTGGMGTVGVEGMAGIQEVTQGLATPTLLTVPAPGREESLAQLMVEAVEQTLTIQDQTWHLTGLGVAVGLVGVECHPRLDPCFLWEEAFLSVEGFIPLALPCSSLEVLEALVEDRTGMMLTNRTI